MHKATNIEMSATEIATLQEGINELKDQFSDFSNSLNEIKIFVAGNQKLDSKDRGLVGRVEKVEKSQERFVKLYWMFVGGSFVVGFIVKWLFSK